MSTRSQIISRPTRLAMLAAATLAALTGCSEFGLTPADPVHVQEDAGTVEPDTAEAASEESVEREGTRPVAAGFSYQPALSGAPPYESGQLTPFGHGEEQGFIIESPPAASSDVTLTVRTSTDMLGQWNFVTILLNGVPVGDVFRPGGSFCPETPDVDQLVLPMQVYNDLLAANGDADFVILASDQVQPFACSAPSFVSVRVDYCGGEDCNENGVPDNCDIANGTSPDVNENGVPDECDLSVLGLNPPEGPVEGGTVVHITGRGFDSSTSVRFGDTIATGVQVVNETTLIVTTPPRPAGAVDVIVEGVVGGLLSVTLTDAFSYFVLEPDDGTDTDGDGLSDVQERRGYEIAVDLFGYGTGVNGGNLVRRTVRSDPTDPDTDGDGVDDKGEWLAQCDPRLADTDEDGLDDNRELNQELTSPVSVDTDGDARGPDGTLPPNAALFDTAELVEVYDDQGHLYYGGTSPIFDDTDGDGVTDYDEFAHPQRSPLVADVPKLRADFVGDLNFIVNTTLSNGQTVTLGEQTGLTESESSTNVTTNESSWENSLEFTESISGSIGYGGTPPGPSYEVEVGFSATQGFSEGGSTSWSEESSVEVQEEFIQFQETTTEETYTVDGGSITASIRFVNEGNIAFTLENVVLSALLIDQRARDGFKPLVNLRPPVDDTTLAAFDATGPIIFETELGRIGGELILELMADPSALVLEVAAFDLLDAEGRNFAFLNDVTNARTATVIIDFGPLRGIETYRVATEVARRPDGRPAGITIGEVLTKILEIPFDTAPRTGSSDPQAFPDGVQILREVRDVATAPGDDPDQFWVVFGDADGAGDGTVDFQDIRLRAGNTLQVVFTEDIDRDGVYFREELMYQSSDENPNSDDTEGDDGLNDYEEIRVGWQVLVAGQAEPRQVYPDPTRIDLDQDGLHDGQERLGPDGILPGEPGDALDATNPKDPDTDDDGLEDGVDNCPTNPFNQAPTIDLTKSADPSGSEVTLSGAVSETLAQGRCDVDAIDTIVIDWDDGQQDTILGDGSSSIDVNITHIYLTQNVDTITVTATDVRGAESTAAFDVDITFPTRDLEAFYPMNDRISIDNVVNDVTNNDRDGTRDDEVFDAVNRFESASGAFCIEQQDPKEPDFHNVDLPAMPVPGDAGDMTLTVWMVPHGGSDPKIVLGQESFCALYQGGFTIKAPDGTFHTLEDPDANTIPTLPVNPCGQNTPTVADWTLYCVVVDYRETDLNGNPNPGTVVRLYRGDGANLGVPGASHPTQVGNSLWIDGVQFSNPDPTQPWQMSGEHDIFGPIVGTTGCVECQWAGRVDDPRIYSAALTLVEIDALFNEADNSDLPGNADD